MEPDTLALLLAALDDGETLTAAAESVGLPYPSPDRQGTPLEPGEDDFLKALLARHVSRGDMARLVGRSPAAISLRLVGVPRTCRDCNAPLPAPRGKGRHPLRCTPCARTHATPTPKAAHARIDSGWDLPTIDALLTALDSGLPLREAAAYARRPYPATDRTGLPFADAEDTLLAALLTRHVPRADMAALIGRTAAAVGMRLTGLPRTCRDCDTELPPRGHGATVGRTRCTRCHDTHHATPPRRRTCPTCKTRFTADHARQQHCSTPCTKRAFYDRLHADEERAKAYRDRSAAQYHRAKNTPVTKDCPRCGTTFTTNAATNRTYCGPGCRTTPRPDAPRKNTPWTPDEDAALTRLYAAAEPLPVIARALGRTAHAVRGRAQVLTLRRPAKTRAQTRPTVKAVA